MLCSVQLFPVLMTLGPLLRTDTRVHPCKILCALTVLFSAAFTSHACTKEAGTGGGGTEVCKELYSISLASGVLQNKILEKSRGRTY